jgi:hypothetical protein
MLFVNDSVQLLQRIISTETLEVFGDFEIGGQVIRTVKYANGLVLLANGDTVLHGHD